MLKVNLELIEADGLVDIESGIWFPGATSMFKEDPLFPLIAELTEGFYNLDQLNRAEEHLALSHDSFIKLTNVEDVFIEIQKMLDRLATNSIKPFALYYSQLASDLSLVTKPDSLSEIMYGEIMATAKTPFFMLRAGFAMDDYNYDVPKGSDRRNTIYAVSRILNRSIVSDTFVSHMEQFFRENQNPQVIVVDEYLIVLGASQAERSRKTLQRPAGSSHLMDRPDGGKRVLIRIYVNEAIVGDKVRTASSYAKEFFSSGFWSSLGFDINDEQQGRFSNGQHWDLIAHEATEAIGTYSLSGSDREMQECLYTAAGFSGLLKMKELGEISENDLIDARIYLLSKISMSLSGDYTGVYISGYALLFQELIKNGALILDQDDRISDLDFSVFDSTMESVAIQLREILSKNPNPMINILGLPEIIRENPVIQKLKTRMLAKIRYGYA